MQDIELNESDSIQNNPWKQAIDDTPGNTTEKLKTLAALPGLNYDKIWRVYSGFTPDLKSGDAIKVLIKLNEWRKGKTILLIPQEFFLSVGVLKVAHLNSNYVHD